MYACGGKTGVSVWVGGDMSGCDCMCVYASVGTQVCAGACVRVGAFVHVFHNLTARTPPKLQRRARDRVRTRETETEISMLSCRAIWLYISSTPHGGTSASLEREMEKQMHTRTHASYTT